MIASQSASGNSATGCRRWMPALLNEDVDRTGGAPRGRNRRPHGVAVGDVEYRGVGAPAVALDRGAGRGQGLGVAAVSAP